MRSCHSAPRWPDTSRANPRSAQRPSGAVCVPVLPGALGGLRILIDSAYVRNVAMLLNRLSTCGVVIALVQTQVLGLFLARLRSPHDDCLDGSLQQFRIVDV